MLRRFLRLFADFRRLETQLADSHEESRLLKFSSDDYRIKCLVADDDLREWKKCAEREVENATSAHHLYEQAMADLRAQREIAAEFKSLFLQEKDKHQEALELLTDGFACRLLGRQIFHHAPLLQPDKPATRERVPAPKSGRDRVREETAAFEERGRTIEQVIQRQRQYEPNHQPPYVPPANPEGAGMTQQHAADLESKEQERFFASAMREYTAPAGEQAA